ncbi:MAG: DUF5009 domain-containing protein [Bacteroidales bacterium]|nr:DUF5009 domain-containing protein [Bacteroidales bacterium]
MSGRIHAIDMLRGLSIIGMVFCSAYSWNCGLPAFMFHCQEPPPDYVFSPEIRGITWVDLVFPFFLFSLGAAFPAALGKKLQKGESPAGVALGLVRRWLTLVVFSLVIGNSGKIFATGAPEILKGAFLVGGWLALFASLVRTRARWLNPLGYVLIAALALAEKFAFGVELSLRSSDIIIMIMAWMALLGGLCWLVTRNRPGLRALVFAFVLAVKALSDYTGVLDCVTVPSFLSWLFSWNFCQYLAIVLPASMIGELLLKEGGNSPAGPVVLIPIAAAVTQLWGLFTRNVIADFGITVALAIAYALLSRSKAGKSCTVGLIGFAALIAGIAFDPIDGGIAKDYCNISYLLCTLGIGCLCLSAFIELENRGRKGGVLSLCGQNPMLAYTIVAGFISPALYACGLLGLLDSLSEGSVFWGLARGVVVTFAMCLCTAFCTRKRIFWRS